MNIPVFNLSNLRKSFFTFLILCIIIGGVSIFGVITVRNSELVIMLSRIDSWYIIIVFLVGNYFVQQQFKKELKVIKETSDYDLKFKRYENRFRRRLAWNTVSLILSGILFILSPRNTFLYIIAIQLLLLPVFYPWKKVIAKELGEDDIVFT